MLCGAAALAGADEVGPAHGVAPADGTIALRGAVIDERDRLPAAGAVVVAAGLGGGATGEAIAIADELGRYELRVVPGLYDVLAYLGDTPATITRRIALVADTDLGTVAVARIAREDCVFIVLPDPTLDTDPRFGLTARRGWAPVARDRTHRAWIAPVVAAGARTAATTLEAGARLPGAPGIPLAFVEEVQTHTLRVPIGLPAGAGGAAAVSLRAGSNQASGDVRIALGLDRPGAPDRTASSALEAFAGGPLKKDRAWIAAGLAADRDHRGARGTHGMLALHYAASRDHQLAVAGLAQAAGDGARGRWANARWTSRLWEHRLELQAIATAEQLATPDAEAIARAAGASGELVDRAGGRLAATWRTRGLGDHRLALSAGGGAGARDRERHADASLAAGDAWDLRANLRLDAGVRWESRTFAGERAAVTATRASLSYDFTREGRADAFVAYQRVPHLDDAAPGRWRALEALAHDEVAAGLGYNPERFSPIMIGAAARARRTIAGAAAPELGLEGWARFSGRRLRLHAAATTLDRAASVLGQLELVDRRGDKLTAGATARWGAAPAPAGPPDAPGGFSGGAALAWRHTGTPWRRSSLEVGLEAHAGAGGPGGRLVVGAAW